MPLFWNKIPAGSATTTGGMFMIFHMTILHSTPLLMTSVNVYFTDIKMLSGDWKLQVWHGLFYAFANWLGQLDRGTAEYPMTDWDNSPMIAITFWTFGVPLMCAFYIGFCNYIQPKRRGEL